MPINSERKYLRLSAPFQLEMGGEIKDMVIAYHTYGTLSPEKDNVVWVCHALTADSNVADWWPNTVERNRFLDPAKNFVVCANIIGSHYGSTGPLSIDPETGAPYYGNFPSLTIRDWVNAHKILAEYLGVNRIDTIIGSSVGGFQAVEWAVDQPERFKRLALIATSHKATPWTIAIDETQRMSIMADETYGEPTASAGAKGLAAARAIGMLTYRGWKGYNLTQQDKADASVADDHRASTYQRYQGEKLCRRFNAYSYVSILNAFDTHDVGRERGGAEEALGRIKANTKVIAITSDIIFTPEEMKQMCRNIPGASYEEIDSEFGHDGFLVESDKLNDLLIKFMQ